MRSAKSTTSTGAANDQADDQQTDCVPSKLHLLNINSGLMRATTKSIRYDLDLFIGLQAFFKMPDRSIEPINYSS